MAQVSLITGVAAMTCITGYHTRKGVRPMVSRLRMMCLGLGILSTVIACAVAPPAMPPPTVAQTSLRQWPLRRIYIFPLRQATGGQTPPNPHRTSVRWMRKSSNTADNAVQRNANKSCSISSGNRSERVSEIRAMNGCGDLPMARRSSRRGMHRRQLFPSGLFCGILAGAERGRPSVDV